MSLPAGDGGLFDPAEYPMAKVVPGAPWDRLVPLALTCKVVERYRVINAPQGSGALLAARAWPQRDAARRADSLGRVAPTKRRGGALSNGTACRSVRDALAVASRMEWMRKCTDAVFLSGLRGNATRAIFDAAERAAGTMAQTAVHGTLEGELQVGDFADAASVPRAASDARGARRWARARAALRTRL